MRPSVFPAFGLPCPLVWYLASIILESGVAIAGEPLVFLCLTRRQGSYRTRRRSPGSRLRGFHRVICFGWPTVSDMPCLKTEIRRRRMSFREHFANAGMSLPPRLVPAWMLPRMPNSEKTQANSSKSGVFIRRSLNTLGLWIGVAGAFVARQAGRILWWSGPLQYWHPQSISRCCGRLECAGTLGLGYWFPQRILWPWRGFIGGGRVESWPGIDAAGVFFALAGAFVLEMRRPIRGVDAMTAVAANVFGFVYVAYLFHFSERIVFLVPGSGQVPGALALLWLVAVTKFTDMGAYITGTLIRLYDN